MKKRFHNTAFVYAALLFWLFASASGMHGHYCFDGMEPPVSVHFDLMTDHSDEDNLGHKDVDSKPMQTGLLKFSGFDLLSLVAIYFLAIIWPIIRGQRYTLSKTPSSWLTVIGLRPPLRAPPAHSH